jgi:hypothetical protein
VTANCPCPRVRSSRRTAPGRSAAALAPAAGCMLTESYATVAAVPFAASPAGHPGAAIHSG